MSKAKAKGYIKQGEVLFVSVRFPHLSLVIDPGGDVAVGDRVVKSKPRFIDFHPGPFGGEFRVNEQTARQHKMSKEKLIEVMRARDAKDEGFCEVLDDEHLARLAEIRDKVVEDKVVIRTDGRSSDELDNKPVPDLPEREEAPAPKAAKGPKRQAAPASV